MSKSTSTQFQLKVDRDVADLVMVPPDGKPPTLDQDVLQELENRIEEIEGSAPRIVFLSSASERFFCVGANISVLKETTPETIIPWVKNGHRILNRLEDLPCPVVALVSGYAMGGGLELAMACDLIFADETAKFAQSEASLGFIPGWGGSRRLVQRIGLAKAKYYFYSGEMLDSQAALDCGLADRICGNEGLDKMKATFAKVVLGNNYNAISTFKKIVNDQFIDQRNHNEEVEATNSVGCLKDEDTIRRLDAFLNKKG